jgi:hypothetical protein
MNFTKLITAIAFAIVVVLIVYMVFCFFRAFEPTYGEQFIDQVPMSEAIADLYLYNKMKEAIGRSYDDQDYDGGEWTTDVLPYTDSPTRTSGAIYDYLSNDDIVCTDAGDCFVLDDDLYYLVTRHGDCTAYHDSDWIIIRCGDAIDCKEIVPGILLCGDVPSKDGFNQLINEFFEEVCTSGYLPNDCVCNYGGGELSIECRED